MSVYLNTIYESITGITDKLSLYTQHACLMHEYMTELIRECMSEYETLIDTKLVAISEHETE